MLLGNKLISLCICQTRKDGNMNNLKAYDTFWLCNYDPSTHKSSLFTEDYANLLSEEWRLKFSRPK